MESSLAVKEAAAIILEGGIVAFPTETYYGLAVDPFNRQALDRLFALKQRSLSKPVLTIIENQAQLSTITTGIPPRFNPLMARFWPGPLTLIFDARSELPARITAASGTIGARISSHSLAHALVKAVGRPITATSANISGQPPALDAARLRAIFGRGLDYILDGGLTPGGQGSTIIGCQGDELRLLRPGVIKVPVNG
ncbi:Threonylcarbamoyl-AMP synthase [hydrothermal vent metagenome]|uniref:L-threonylcarbamoyladenylate synthase n=1 Tax=hydrothermal vent metagenome TaxID=652676 RepID=A0A3B0VUB6_9ZZZZ